MSKELIENYLSKAQKRFSENKLFGGNCGTFAIGFASFLKDFHDLELEFGFIYESFGEEHESIKEVLELETRVYHCFLMYNGDMLDGSGFINDDYLCEFAEVEYADKSPGCFIEIKQGDNDFNLLVRNDTNWSISENKFYNFFKNNLIKSRNKKNKP